MNSVMFLDEKTKQTSRAAVAGIWNRMMKVIGIVSLYRNWYTVLLDRSRLIPSGLIRLRFRNGGILFVRGHTGDCALVNDIWIHNTYTPPLLWTIEPDWIVVDLGSHLGAFTLLAAMKAREVIAVEANPDLFAIARRSLEASGVAGKVRIVQGAISREGPTVLFHISPSLIDSSAVRSVDTPPAKVITVPALSMSELCADVQAIDLLKIDIEGSEYELLLSPTSPDWLTKVRRIALEYHDHVEGWELPSSFDALMCRLQEEGFRILALPTDGLLYGWKPGCGPNQVIARGGNIFSNPC